MSADYAEILRLYRKYSVREGEPLWEVFVRVGQELEGSGKKRNMAMSDDESLDGYCGANPDAARKVFERRNRKLSDPGDVPPPPSGSEGLPIPASQDPLRSPCLIAP